MSTMDVATAATADDGDVVQTLVRGLAVILAFDADHAELTLSDVARRTNLSRAATRRFLQTLVAIGYVSSDGRLFSLRPRVLELGQAYLSTLSLPTIAQPHLDALVSSVGESASMAVLDGLETVSVARAVAHRRIMILANSVGTRFPAYAVAVGRVLLAHQPAEWVDDYMATARFDKLTHATIVDPEKLRAVLARVKRQEYCFVNEELSEGLRSCAVPIKSVSGEVTAAINVSVHYSRASADAVRKMLLGPLQEARQAIETDLRHVPG
jgi:IclR family pca regulon transcriptional regulator